MSLIEQSIPIEILDLFAEMEAIMTIGGYSKADQVRYMGLFMFKQLRENAASIPPAQVTKMLGSLHVGHKNAFEQGLN